MAYKFQFGQAVLSGALEQEGDVDITESGALKIAGTTAIDASRVGSLTSLAVSDLTAGRVTLAGTSGELEDSANFTFDGSEMGVTGDIAFSGVAKGLTEFAVSQGEGIAAFSFNNSGATTVAVSSSIAGAGLGWSSGIASVNVDDSGIEINADSLRLKDDGVTLAKMAGIARGSILHGDASGDPAALSVGSAHQFLQSDGTDLAYVSMSGDATLNAGVMSIGNSKITNIMLSGNIAADKLQRGTALADDAGVMRLDSSVAGDGIGFASEVLAVNVDDSSIETNADALRVKALGITASMLSGNIPADKLQRGTALDDDGGVMRLDASVAGDGLGFASEVLAVNVDDSSIETNADALRVKALGITASMLSGNIPADKLQRGTALADDAGVMRLDSSVAGAGIGFTSEVLAVLVDDSGIEINVDTLQLKADGVKDSHIDWGTSAGQVSTADIPEETNLYYTDVRSRASVSATDAGGDGSFAYNSGSGVFTYTGPSASETRAHFGVADTNSIDMSYDAGTGVFQAAMLLSGSTSFEVDAGGLKLKSSVAGAGLSLSASGELSVDSATAPVAYGDADAALSEGFNYGSAALTAARVLTMPAPGEAGDIVQVKAPANCSSTLTVTIQGATVDGETAIVLESPYAAVSMVCVDAGSDLWRLF